MSELIKRQDAIDVVARSYRYESDRMTALQELPVITELECLDAVEMAKIAVALEELKKYKHAEKQGLLLKLPCKVGDTIFAIPSKVNYDLNIINGYSENNRVYEQKVHSVVLFSNDKYLLTTCDGPCSVVSDFYKETWFLTKEEAEQALEMLSGKN